MTVTISSHDKWPADRWKSGPYFAFAADFNKEKLGRDRVKLSVTIGDRAPDGTVIDCVTPESVSQKGPRGYASIRHGRVNDDARQVTIGDTQIGKLARLEDDFALDFTAPDGGDANVLFDAFFLADPARHASRVVELGVIPYPSGDARKFEQTGVRLGVHTDRFGVAWRMTSFSSGYVIAIPVGMPILSGTIDRLEMLRWLLAKGIGRPDLWYTGTGLGLEPIAGTTRLTIRRWSPIVR